MDQTPNEDAAVSPAQEAVGSLLRAARLGQGQVIADVARALRISHKYLEALEDGRNQDLPGTTYAIGFVRSYAEYLDLDGEEIVRRYKDQAEDLQDKTDLVFPKPIPDGGVPGAAVLGLGVVLAGLAYGVWYWNSNSDGVRVARVDPVPAPLAAAQEQAPASVDSVLPEALVQPTNEEPKVEDAPATPPPTPVVEDVVEPAPVSVKPVDPAASVPPDHVDVAPPASPVVDAPKSAKETSADPVAPVLVEQGANEAPAPATPAAPAPVVEAPVVEEHVAEVPAAEVSQPVVPVATAPASHAGGSRITVRAKSNSWIQVRDSVADRLLFTRLLRKGDEYQVPNRAGLRLMTGNAGALEVLVDGTVVPAIGAVGEVRRDVELDPEKLKSGGGVGD